ncbi:MAG TPA: PQQ-dependent dehydrogenase, methanol/ethanol family, partial [Acidobacteriaceae bacterium]|nr:PQQ-dependent dehydrogenase, methanol/ethanol family [Acidobacteriaceae bacterium]
VHTVRGPWRQARKILGTGGCIAVAAAFLCVAPSPAQRADAPDTVRNPFSGDPAAIAAGKLLYEQTCQSCHGGEARGDRGPALAAGNFRHGSEDSDLFQNVRSGIPGTQMPAFSALPTDTVWRILAYIRSLNGDHAMANETVPGDAAAGEKTFWGSAGCGSCHEVNGRGGIVGPDLSAAGTSSADYLRNAILDPGSAQPRRRRFAPPSGVSVTTRNGQSIRGIRVAEDSYTLILRDLNGKLRRFDKQNLAGEHSESASLMPADYGRLLSPADVQNVVAYLKSLKERDLSKTIQVDRPGGLSFARLRNAQREPQNWLTYWGDYQGHHFSALDQINVSNVRRLQAQWSVQMPGSSTLEATPLVVDGTMYTTGSPGQVFAIDAKSGLQIWRYERRQKTVNPYQSNPFNRGVAVLGNRVFFGTLDAALVALDAQTGRVLWETQVADTLQGYTITAAPLAIQDKVIVGVAGGEFGIRGFIDAYDAATGKRLWRFNTVPGPGEFGNETWSGDSWKHGSGATWMTGAYDPEIDTLYWPVGNPGPDLNGSVRKGDNLFTCSVVALDPATGQRKWHYQFTPGDTHDWDANEDLVLADQTIAGRRRKLMLQANRNGMFYVLDRTNGEFVFAKPYIRQTWNRGFQKDGRPILTPDWEASPTGNVVFPALSGGANWQNPSYDPVHSMLYVAAADSGMGYRSSAVKYEAGRQYMGGAPFPSTGSRRYDVLAIDTTTGTIKWRFPISRVSLSAGVLATRGGVVFVGTAEGNLIALDGRSGKSLWHFQTGAAMASSPMSYSAGGRQYIAVSAGNVLYSFALPD